MTDQPQYDVVIIGAGIAGSILAAELGAAGKKVLMLDAGPGVPDNRSEYMDNFYMSNAKTPESPYPPLTLEPGIETAPRATILGLNNWTDPEKSYLVQPQPLNPVPNVQGNAQGTAQVTNQPFASTYERVGGGTTWHWLGTSLRLVPHDLEMYTQYGVFDPAADWPIGYEELSQLYGKAEAAIGVSASVAQQAPLEDAIGLTYPSGYQYPMNPIPLSVVDQAVSQGVSGLSMPSSDDKPVFITPTPAGRNSQPYQNRRVCAGNTNCIPICPIQAKYDATVTLARALNTGNVTVRYKSVVSKLIPDANGRIAEVEYLSWDLPNNPQHIPPPSTTVSGTAVILAAHAIENSKILLLSANEQFPNGLANSSDQVGRNLMDHVLYLSWALMPDGQQIWPYRGPLSTSGIESLRDGEFRRKRAAFRMEIGNEGWNFPIGDPYVTVQDFINGTNFSRLNPITPPGSTPAGPPQALGGVPLAQAINDRLTRQFRIACLLEQSPQSTNRVTLDPTYTDGLGLARPKISYGLDQYTLDGFAAARQTCSAIYQQMNATEFTDYSQAQSQPGYFEYDGVPYVFFGAGHLVGTHRMGASATSSVTNAAARSWDHQNLWIVGSGTFPTVATPNPTLTLAALAFKTAADVLTALAG